MSSNKIGLIIQGTLSGLTNLIVSPNMTSLLESPSVKSSLLDERNEVAQYVRNTQLFSVESNAQLQIFSIILTDKLDAFKRAGYVAIRLYFPNGVVTKQPIAEILNQLKDKYEEISKNNIGSFELHASQFFDIVNAIPTSTVPTSVSLGIKKKAYVQFDVNSEDISQKIQQLPSKSYFSKIYFVANTLAANLIQNGFIEVSGLTFSKLTINGMFQLVDKITIQNQVVAFNRNDFSLLLNVLPSDQVVIDYKDGRNEVVSAQKGFHNLTQKPKPAPRPMHGQQKGTSKKSNNELLFLGGLVAVLGLGLFLFWMKNGEPAGPSIENQKKTAIKDQTETISDTTELQANVQPSPIEYKLNGDVLECTVVDKSNDPFVWRNPNNDSIGLIKFGKYKEYHSKIGVLKANSKFITDTSELSKIYKKFKLDKLLIEEKLNSINVNNQPTTQKNSTKNTSSSRGGITGNQGKPVLKVNKQHSNSSKEQPSQEIDIMKE